MDNSETHSERYVIRLDKEAFTFCAAHFITYAGNVCEPIHGHNYSVSLEAEGPLDENAYVLDFIATRDKLVTITSMLDHKMLLPTEHPMIRVEASDGPLGGGEVVATFENRRWVFPQEECVLLPVANTTAELLARWIGQQFLSGLRKEGIALPDRLAITVDECQGQVGVCRFDQS